MSRSRRWDGRLNVANRSDDVEPFPIEQARDPLRRSRSSSATPISAPPTRYKAYADGGAAVEPEADDALDAFYHPSSYASSSSVHYEDHRLAA